MTEDQAGTLVAQDHGHHPAVLQSAGFCTEHSAKAGNIGYEEETSPTLRAGVVPAAMLFDNHAQEARYDGLLEGSPTVTARYGSGGNNQPLVVDGDPAALAADSGQTLFQPVGFDRYNGNVTGDVAQTLNACAGTSGDNQPMVFQEASKAYGIAKEAFNAGEKSAFNFAVNEEISPTIQATGPGAVAKPESKAYGVCSKGSHAMLSDNPRSGFYEADTSRTLDQSGGNAVTSNQGGICVLSPDPAYALQGSMIGRENRNGPQGDGVNEGVSFTLNTCDKHAVAQPTYAATVGSFLSVSEEKAQTLMARDFKDPQIVNTPGDVPMYIVRRLTPVECARLQGFPDWWCTGLETEHPSEEEISFWEEVFETHRRLIRPGGKPKSRKQIVKWLQHPHTDSAEYSMWGNGVCLNNVYFVLSGIVWADTLP